MKKSLTALSLVVFVFALLAGCIGEPGESSPSPSLVAAASPSPSPVASAIGPALEPSPPEPSEPAAPEEETGEPAEPREPPSSYHMEEVPYYAELGFCYGGSAMMVLKYDGFSEEQVQQYKTAVKSGLGGPPDLFNGFAELDMADRVRIAYSKNYVKEYEEFYSNNLLQDAEKQTTLFDDGEQALRHLKQLVSSDTPVIILVHNGNHYVVAIGYDDDFVYTNDPGLDNVYDYKIDSGQGLKQRRISMNDFMGEWTIAGFEGGGIGFPGDYGMIWLAEEGFSVE